MDRYDFRTESGDKINLFDYTLDQIKLWPNLTIRVGTDSQNYGDNTIYVTCIIYRYGNRGASYVYFKERVPRIRVEFNRLYGEGVRTIEAADLLTSEIPVGIQCLEFDYADTKKTISRQLVDIFRNWGQYTVDFKSGEMLACKAADHICRH